MSTTLQTPNRSLGRPRSEQSRTAILNAAYEFLEDQPVALISLLHIARKAGVSTATLYRWWSTKETLLMDAFLHKTKDVLILGTEGTPLERMRQYVIRVGHLFSGKAGVIVARLLTAIQDNPSLRNVLMERISSPRSNELLDAVMEAINAGQLPRETNVKEFADMLLGPLFIRLVIGHEPISEKFVLSTFEQQVAGANARSATSKRKRKNRPRT